MIYEYGGASLPNGLYYLYAGWSSKCNLIKERIERISKEHPSLNIYRVNTTKFPQLKAEWQITRIPSYVYVESGTVKEKMMGNVDLFSLQKWVNHLVKE